MAEAMGQASVNPNSVRFINIKLIGSYSRTSEAVHGPTPPLGEARFSEIADKKAIAIGEMQ